MNEIQIGKNINKNALQQWLRKHRADKVFRKVCTLNKLWFRWTSNRFESPTFLSLNVGGNRTEPEKATQIAKIGAD